MKNLCLKPSLVAIVISLAVQGCGEGGSSSAGAGYGGGADTGGDSGNSGNSGNNTTTAYDSALMLANLTDNIIVPTYESFVVATQTQQDSVAAYCQGLSANDGDTAGLKLIAQNDWKALASNWQEAEVMQIGPLTDNSYALRNSIYSWPVISQCGVDQDVVYFELGQINGSPYELSQRTDTRRGIDALEHLLFSASLDHHCTANIGPLSDWNSRSDDERLQARCLFAQAVIDDLHVNATTLVDAWTGDNGYAATLKAAGEVGSAFATALKGVNVVTDAMFYLDSVAKDAKLAKPLGLLDNNCGSDICPQQVESLPSGYSMNNLAANIKGFSKLFFASQSGEADDQSFGFDDFLIDVGDAQTAQNLTEGIATVKQLAASLDQSVEQLLQEDVQQVEHLHGGIKTVTDELKTNFITSLALELPQTSAGDND